MEAIAAFAIACNVVQIVDFGLKAVSNIQQIYKAGTTIDHAALDDCSQRLADLTSRLEQAIEDAQTPKPLTKVERDLQQLAGKCNKAARDLNMEVARLRGGQGRRAAVATFLKSTRRKAAIYDLRRQLQEYKGILDSQLLVQVYEKFNTAVLENQEDFSRLDESLKIFITQLTDGHTTIADMTTYEARVTRDHVTEEGVATRDCIAASLQQLQVTNSDAEKQQHLLNSLYYPDIDKRQDAMQDPHQTTFGWIFDNPESREYPWDDFRDWLINGNDVYWINGKAGSGKSTLMNYIYLEVQTRQSLEQWSPSGLCNILKFFFWNPGSELQKTSEGLLRSLAYQILQQNSSILQRLVGGTVGLPAPEQTWGWSDKRLKHLLISALDLSSHSTCIFLDGLDEYEDDEGQLVLLIQGLRSRTDVKICVSSRPSLKLEKLFRGTKGLRLQDLTHSDIQTYVHGSLGQEMSRVPEYDYSDSLGLQRAVVDKAQGVFLWVKLAVRYLLLGMTNQDTCDQLRERLEMVPDEIEGLYMLMLKRNARLNDIESYRREAALYFCLIAKQEMSLLEFTIATSADVQVTYVEGRGQVQTSELLAKCKRARVRAIACSAGLLEVTDKTANEEADLTLADVHFDTQVRFFHRTARDFLLRYATVMFDPNDTVFAAKAFRNFYRSQLVLPFLIERLYELSWLQTTLHILDSVPEKWFVGAYDKHAESETATCQSRDDTPARNSLGESCKVGERFHTLENFLGECLRSTESVCDTAARRYPNGDLFHRSRLSKDKRVYVWRDFTVEPTDFLGCVICYERFQHWALGRLDSSNIVDRAYFSYLLSRISGLLGNVQAPSVFVSFMERGADPMQSMDVLGPEYVGVDAWWVFILNLWYPTVRKGVHDTSPALLFKNINAFLGHGASLTTLMALPAESLRRRELERSRWWQTGQGLSVYILKTSALSILRLLYRNQSCLVEFEKQHQMQNEETVFDLALECDNSHHWWLIDRPAERMRFLEEFTAPPVAEDSTSVSEEPPQLGKTRLQNLEGAIGSNGLSERLIHQSRFIASRMFQRELQISPSEHTQSLRN